MTEPPAAWLLELLAIETTGAAVLVLLTLLVMASYSSRRKTTQGGRLVASTPRVLLSTFDS